MQTERRGSPRVAVRNQRAGVRVSSRVRVLDMSSGGALLSGLSMAQGVRGALRVPLSPVSLACEVEVRQEQVLVGNNGLEARVGIAFVNMSAESRLALDRLLGGAKR